ncbi:MAG: DNA cytosine methyltransferase [Chthoniobacterales bacterium]|nr:DNA cytosine methyltransferase [Chthoniobacterales bacterium]
MHQINGHRTEPMRFIDLFCGIGGFRFALEAVARRYSTDSECVFSSDIDADCQKAYEAKIPPGVLSG